MLDECDGHIRKPKTFLSNWEINVYVTIVDVSVYLWGKCLINTSIKGLIYQHAVFDAVGKQLCHKTEDQVIRRNLIASHSTYRVAAYRTQNLRRMSENHFTKRVFRILYLQLK